MQAAGSQEVRVSERPRNWGDRVPPTIEAEAQATHSILKLNGVKCNEANALDIADDLAASWKRALDEGYHVWTLHDGEHSVADTADLQELPKAPVRKRLGGYHLRCWSCGLSYPTARRKAMNTGCAATRLLNKECSAKGRVMGRHWSLEACKADLDAKNKEPARSHLHWPECVEEQGSSTERWLRCTKCGYKVPASRSTRFYKEFVIKMQSDFDEYFNLICGEDSKLDSPPST